MKHFFELSELPRLAVTGDQFDVAFIHTDNISVAFNELQAGAVVPVHQHMHETIDYVQEGEIQMTIGDETVRMTAGTVARVPSDVPHGATAMTKCKVINIFYPKREDFDTER